MENYSISLPSYSIGNNVYEKINEICLPFGKKAICIGGKTAISKIKNLIIDACKGSELEILGFLWYGGDATYANVEKLEENELVKNADIIFAIGG
ncbi:MAG: glycerol dehydrogenase, partial [Eubacteriales bacterium]|nr:glycerol dehydrogenase [Eubacteriales bacterium]